MASASAPITISLPSKYSASGSSSSSSSSSSPPPLHWLTRTWTVTHSTLAMWRSARNVRITYKELPPKDGTADGARLDDLVEYEPGAKDAVVKTVSGIDSPATTGGGRGWDWRGKGCLFFVGSHWEILAWGEEPVEEEDGGGGGTERWAVTWFAPTVFTKEGFDIYCDRREGLSERTYAAIMEALRKVDAREVVRMVEADMRPVEIRLPWAERK